MSDPIKNTTNFPPVTNAPAPKKNWLIWLFITLAVLLVGAGAYYLGLTMNKKISSQIQSSPTPSEQPNESTPPIETVKPITDPGVSWLSKPEKLGDLGLFNVQNYSSDYNSYYKIANLVNGGQLIYAQIQTMGTITYRFKKDSAGTYYLIAKNSDFSAGNEQDLLNKEKYDKSLIQIDWSTSYDSLTPPQTLVFDGAELKSETGGFNTLYENMATSSVTFKKMGSTVYGDIYKEEYPQGNDPYSKLRRIDYFVKLADTSLVYYTTRKDFLADDGTLVTTFTSDGQIFKSKKFNIGLSGRGCGRGPMDELYEGSNLPGRLTQIGTTSSGDALYTATDANDDIFKTAYETYEIGRAQDKELLSYESFAAKKPVLIWKDPFGNYLVFMDKDYDMLAECGKPVIYLYPEKTTSVSVKVGADIKISEPEYQSGWQVVANPNGSILNQDGKIYDSLYWEGTGSGFYPSITQGRVVSSKNFTTELRNDLAALGLNKKESDDFITFWSPKMPDAPYIRLTWLTTNEMNKLAPLSVSPRPDTIARVFLDFQGQNSPETNMAPQQLLGFKRKGFTLVEWGGLLIGGR